jgi:dodecin
VQVLCVFIDLHKFQLIKKGTFPDLLLIYLFKKENDMSVARITEIKSSSKISFDDAIKEGLKKTAKTIENLKSAWVGDQEVLVDDRGNITEFRVLLKITFVVKE